MYEKFTKCPNFTWYLPENARNLHDNCPKIFPEFFGAHVPTVSHLLHLKSLWSSFPYAIVQECLLRHSDLINWDDHDVFVASTMYHSNVFFFKFTTNTGSIASEDLFDSVSERVSFLRACTYWARRSQSYFHTGCPPVQLPSWLPKTR